MVHVTYCEPSAFAWVLLCLSSAHFYPSTIMRSSAVGCRPLQSKVVYQDRGIPSPDFWTCRYNTCMWVLCACLMLFITLQKLLVITIRNEKRAAFLSLLPFCRISFTSWWARVAFSIGHVAFNFNSILNWSQQHLNLKTQNTGNISLALSLPPSIVPAHKSWKQK